MLTTPGARTLTASYAGDADFNPSPPSAGAAHQVNPAGTTTTIGADAPDPSLVGESVPVEFAVAVVAPGSGTPTGNVTVTDGTDACTATVAAGGCDLVLTTTGSRTLTATYSGDASFGGSTSAGETHQVDSAVTTISIASDDPDPSLIGQNVTVVYGVAVAPPGAGTPSRTVTVSDGVDSCIATVAAGQCDLSLSTAGARTLTASYAGDGSFAGSTSAGTPHEVTVQPTTTQIDAHTPAPSVTGQAVLVTVSVTSGAGTPSGSALVDDGAGDGCTATLAGGTGSCTVTPSQAGALTLTATYSGDAEHATSFASTSHLVNPAATTLQLLDALPDPAPAGGTVTVHFVVAIAPPGTGTPGGTVTVDDGQGAQCSAPPAAGQCSLTLGGAGSRVLTAAYSGDASYEGSASTNTLPLQVAATIPALSGAGLAALAGLLAAAAIALRRRASSRATPR